MNSGGPLGVPRIFTLHKKALTLIFKFLAIIDAVTDKKNLDAKYSWEMEPVFILRERFFE